MVRHVLEQCAKSVALGFYDSMNKQNMSQTPAILNTHMLKRMTLHRYANLFVKRERKKVGWRSDRTNV